MLKHFYLLLFLFLFSFSRLTYAQVFPFQNTVQLTPPYTLYLSDYTNESQKLIVTLLLTEPAVQDYPFKLKITIKGSGVNLTTNPNFRPARPLYISGGIPYLITGDELGPYFNPENILFSGLDKSEFLRTKRLPEGYYEICIQVMDYQRGFALSRETCASAWIMLNSPPLLNLPANNSKVRLQEPQTVLFQWTPLHLSSPNSAFTTDYQFTLTELTDKRNPNDAIVSQKPLYQTFLTETQFVYGLSEPSLIPGKVYAWRVQARDVENKDVFQNSGYSETYTFQYGQTCGPPTGVVAEAINSEKINIYWDANPGATAYRVELKGNNSDNWIYRESLTTTYNWSEALAANNEYDIRVIAICGYGGVESAPSTIVRVKTPADYTPSSASCGQPMPVIDLSNQTLRSGTMNKGDIILMADMPLKLVEVSGTDGTYSGVGWDNIPFFNNAKCYFRFANIKVNTDNRMIGGKAVLDSVNIGLLDSNLSEMLRGFMSDIERLLDDVTGLGIGSLEDMIKRIDDYLNNYDGPDKDAIRKAVKRLIADVAEEIKSWKKGNIGEKVTRAVKIKAKMELLLGEVDKMVAGTLRRLSADLERIVREVLGEMKTSTSDKIKSDQLEVTANNQQLNDAIQQINNGLNFGDNNQENVQLLQQNQQMTPVIVDQLKRDPKWKKYFDAKNKIKELEKIIMQSLAGIAFVYFILEEPGIIKDLCSNLENKIKEILERSIEQLLKGGGSEDEIKRIVRDEIKSILDQKSTQLVDALKNKVSKDNLLKNIFNTR